MAIGNNAAALAAQLEKVHSSDLEQLFNFDSVLWPLIKARPNDSTSTRPERIVFQVSNGAKSRAVNLDGGDLGRGGGPQFVYGSVAPVSFDWIIEWTKLSEIATDSPEKAVINYAKATLKTHAKTAAFNMDSLLSYGDGANTIGVVQNNSAGVAYDSTNFIIYVDNARRFYTNQDVDMYSALNTTMLSTFTITGVDPLANALYLNAQPLGAGGAAVTPQAGYLLLQNNSSGAASSGLNGVLALQVNSNTGFYAGGISRAQYPGLFSTPAVNAQGATLTPAIARFMLNQLIYARGADVQRSTNVKLHMGLDQRAAWENTGINVTQNIQAGNTTARDMLAPEMVETMGGIPILTNTKAIAGRIDYIDFDTYYRTEVAPLDMYRTDAGTVFPLYGASGGLAAGFVSYMYWVGQVMCENPRANAFLYNLALPAGYV